MTWRPFTVVVASGKGGTGKTSVATSLARVTASRGSRVVLVDGDVDAPNASILLGGSVESTEPVTVPLPAVSFSACTLCGACARVCRYRAITLLGKTVLVFPELCHACGGCAQACPERAITEEAHRVGEIRVRRSDRITVVEGVLDIGQVKAPAVVRQAKQLALDRFGPGTDVMIVDAPPGTSCAVVSCLLDADFLILVTEPTPFGLHDLRLAVELGRILSVPLAVVVNRDGSGDTDIVGFCSEQDIRLVARIPFSREVAAAYARGDDLLAASETWASAIDAVYMTLREAIQTKGISHT